MISQLCFYGETAQTSTLERSFYFLYNFVKNHKINYIYHCNVPSDIMLIRRSKYENHQTNLYNTGHLLDKHAH